LIIEQVYQSLSNFLEQSGKAYRTLYYEDICADPAAFVHSTCEDLGLSPPTQFDGAARLKILRDELNEEWIERFHTGR
jgi:LPS sulfotransferase NodH